MWLKGLCDDSAVYWDFTDSSALVQVALTSFLIMNPHNRCMALHGTLSPRIPCVNKPGYVVLRYLLVHNEREVLGGREGATCNTNALSRKGKQNPTPHLLVKTFISVCISEQITFSFLSRNVCRNPFQDFSSRKINHCMWRFKCNIERAFTWRKTFTVADRLLLHHPGSR